MPTRYPWMPWQFSVSLLVSTFFLFKAFLPQSKEPILAFIQSELFLKSPKDMTLVSAGSTYWETVASVSAESFGLPVHGTSQYLVIKSSPHVSPFVIDHSYFDMVGTNCKGNLHQWAIGTAALGSSWRKLTTYGPAPQQREEEKAVYWKPLFWPTLTGAPNIHLQQQPIKSVLSELRQRWLVPVPFKAWAVGFWHKLTLTSYKARAATHLALAGARGWGPPVTTDSDSQVPSWTFAHGPRITKTFTDYVFTTFLTCLQD